MQTRKSSCVNATSRRVPSARYADLSPDKGVRHPVLDWGGGYNIQSWMGGYNIQSWMGGGYPIQSWTGVPHPILDRGQYHPSHPELMGLPPYPDQTWDGVHPSPSAGWGTPPPRGGLTHKVKSVKKAVIDV